MASASEIREVLETIADENNLVVADPNNGSIYLDGVAACYPDTSGCLVILDASGARRKLGLTDLYAWLSAHVRGTMTR